MCAVALDLWGEMLALERRVDDLFRSFLGPRARWLFPTLGRGLHRPFVPATDVLAKDGTLVIRIDLPGLDPKDVSLAIEEGDLVVRGAKVTADYRDGILEVVLPGRGQGYAAQGEVRPDPGRQGVRDPPPPRARMVKVLV